MNALLTGRDDPPRRTRAAGRRALAHCSKEPSATAVLGLVGTQPTTRRRPAGACL